jgi:hypothetical protein
VEGEVVEGEDMLPVEEPGAIVPLPVVPVLSGVVVVFEVPVPGEVIVLSVVPVLPGVVVVVLDVPEEPLPDGLLL